MQRTKLGPAQIGEMTFPQANRVFRGPQESSTGGLVGGTEVHSAEDWQRVIEESRRMSEDGG